MLPSAFFLSNEIFRWNDAVAVHKLTKYTAANQLCCGKNQFSCSTSLISRTYPKCKLRQKKLWNLDSPTEVIGTSLSELHTSRTALRRCVRIQPCLRPYTVNFKCAFKYFPKIERPRAFHVIICWATARMAECSVGNRSGDGSSLRMHGTLLLVCHSSYGYSLIVQNYTWRIEIASGNGRA